MNIKKHTVCTVLFFLFSVLNTTAYADFDKIFSKQIRIENREESIEKSTVNNPFKLALEYKLKLSFKGITYSPMQDRLDNDIILMSRLLSLRESGVNRFGSYQIRSTKGKAFVNDKRKIVYVNYKSTSSELKSFLFTTIRRVDSKQETVQKSSTKKPKTKIKTAETNRSSVEVEIVQGSKVQSIVPIPVRKESPFINYISINPQK